MSRHCVCVIIGEIHTANTETLKQLCQVLSFQKMEGFTDTAYL